MTFHKAASCAFQEIDGLRGHGSATEAMLDFCAKTLTQRVEFFKGDYGRENAIYSFYIFSAAVPHKGGPNYGEAFASLIEEAELGKVWESPRIKNNAFHPDHSNQIWVWAPDRDALVKWYKKNGGKK